MESMDQESGRPKALRKGNRRDEIIEVATRCFLDQGYSGTTMSAIFEHVGGSRSTLYGHFPSKELLFADVLKFALRDYRADFQLVLRSSNDPRRTLTDFCQRFIERLVAPEGIALQRLIIDATRHFAHVGTVFFEEGPMVTHKLLMDYFVEQNAAGTLACEDPGEAARLLTSLCTGGLAARVLWDVEQVTPQAVKSDVDQFVGMFLRFYGRPAAGGLAPATASPVALAK